MILKPLPHRFFHRTCLQTRFNEHHISQIFNYRSQIEIYWTSVKVLEKCVDTTTSFILFQCRSRIEHRTTEIFGVH